MGSPIFGGPPKPAGFERWEDWAASLADFLELQGGNVQELALTGYAATPLVLGYQNFAAGSLVAPVSLTVPAGTVVAYIQVEGQQVRFLDNGAAPTAISGILIDILETLPYSGDFTALKLIEVAPSATINVEYRK